MKLQQFLDVSQSRDILDLDRTLVAFANDLGFGIINGSYVVDRPGVPPHWDSFGNIPAAWVEAFHNYDRGQRDPTLQRIKSTSTPFIYDQGTYVKAGTADLWETQSEFGFKTGVAAALHLPNHKHFFIGCDGPDAISRDEDHLAFLLGSMQLLVVYAHGVAAKLFDPEESLIEVPKLTKRELEVLRWTRDGKSAWAIGQILAISENTVNVHVQHITRKFGVGSKHQAVVRAIGYGLI